jgi:hypothetical protein
VQHRGGVLPGEEQAAASSELIGSSSISSTVTMPKFPFPPRTARNSSGSLSGQTFRIAPSAVTISTVTTWSEEKPCSRPSEPSPPPGV